MMTTDRRIRYGEAPMRGIAMVWAVACVAYIIFRWNDILTMNFPDADDAMRLVQVRDLIAGQGWFDLHQYRIAPPDGAFMHWSRIVDLPLAALILLLRPLLGQELAETVTATIVPLALLGATMAVIGRLTWRLLGKEAAIFACIALPLMPLVLAQFGPLRIDHHAWQILMSAVALYALSWRQPVMGARVAGLAMGVGTVISLELLPMAAIFALVFLARWLCDQRERTQLPAYLQILAASQIVLFALTRGPDLAPWCDAIAPAHLAFFAIAALGTSAIARVPQLPPVAILVGLGLTGGAGLAWFATASPQCLGSPFGNLDPLVYDYWYLNVMEGQPIWRLDGKFIAIVLPQVLISLGLGLFLALRNRNWLQRWWFEYSFVLFAAALAGVVTTRSLAMAAVLGSVALGWGVAQLMAASAETRKPLRKLVGVAAIVLALVPAVGVTLAQPLVARSSSANGVMAKAQATDETCDTGFGFGMLERMEQHMLLSQIDLGPAILAQTPHRVLATAHHRGQLAMRDTIQIFTLPAEEARPMVANLGAYYLLTCTEMNEVRLYRNNASRDALAWRLHEGQPPEWLEPVANADLQEGFVLWRVDRSAMP